MSVTHANATRNTLCDTAVDLLDVGGTGTLVMADSSDVTVATLTFSATAFGSAQSGSAVANAITSDTNAVGGTIAKAFFKNGSGTEKWRCSVTATGNGGDITLSSVIISAGQTVAITSLIYAAPA